MRALRIRQHLEKALAQIGDDEEFTASDVYELMVDYRNRPSVISLGRYLRRYAYVCDKTRVGDNNISIWRKKTPEELDERNEDKEQ